LIKQLRPDAFRPSTDVHPGLPPILILHGDQDPTVPYQQSVRLHELLDEAHQINELYTIRGGKHGMFGEAEMSKRTEKCGGFQAARRYRYTQVNVAH